MRLKQLENGHRLRHKLLLKIMQVFMGGRVPDVMRTVMYRPEFFGKPFSGVIHPVMRFSGEWSAGECELFAAFVSRKNQCPF